MKQELSTSQGKGKLDLDKPLLPVDPATPEEQGTA